MKSLHTLFIHGVGEQHAGFSTEAQHRLSAALQPRGFAVYGQEALWAPVLDRYELEMEKAVARRGSSNRPAQRLVMGTLADALCYKNCEAEILELIDVAYARLRAPEGITIAAHSLGGLIMTDWLRTRPTVKVDRFLSFGCNLQLFNLGGTFACPEQLVAPGKWTNFFDEDDMLGFPLSAWQPQVRDVEVSVGGLLGGTGLAHTAYWSDNSFWSKHVPRAI